MPDREPPWGRGGGTHQCFGVEGGSPFSESSPPFYSGENRQFLHCVSRKSPWRHKVSELPPGCTGTPVLGFLASGFAKGDLHSGSCDPGSGPPVQDWSSPRRVETPSRSCSPPMDCLHQRRLPTAGCGSPCWVREVPWVWMYSRTCFPRFSIGHTRCC